MDAGGSCANPEPLPPEKSSQLPAWPPRAGHIWEPELCLLVFCPHLDSTCLFVQENLAAVSKTHLFFPYDCFFQSQHWEWKERC